MPCTPIKLGGGGVAIVCTRGGKRCGCGRPAIALCDWKLRGPKKGKTCSAPLCASCTTKPAILVEDRTAGPVEVVDPKKDICPAHARVWRAHPKHPANLRCGSQDEGDGLDQLLGRRKLGAMGFTECPEHGTPLVDGECAACDPRIAAREGDDPPDVGDR